MESRRYDRNEVEMTRESQDVSDLRFKSGGIKECHCRVRAPMWTSWSDDNPGRRFVGCRFYQDPTKACKYFQWIYPDINERYKKIIVSLRSEMKLLKKEHGYLKDQEERMKKKIAKLKEKLSESEIESSIATEASEKKLIEKAKEKEKKLKLELRKTLAKESRYWLAIAISWIVTLAVVIGSLKLDKSSTIMTLP